MKKYIFSFVLLALLTHCKCEGTFQAFEKVQNLSSTDIIIKAYRDGMVVSDIITIQSGTNKQIGRAGGRGKGNGFPGTYSISDSIVVDFGSKSKAVHYGRRIGKTPNAIPLSNGRNLYNEANYVRKTLIEDKCRLETEFIYTFTEADYLNAK